MRTTSFQTLNLPVPGSGKQELATGESSGLAEVSGKPLSDYGFGVYTPVHLHGDMYFGGRHEELFHPGGFVSARLGQPGNDFASGRCRVRITDH